MQVLDIIREIQPTDDAKSYNQAIQGNLVKHGFDIKTEVRVSDRGDGRPGKIDIVASLEGKKYAIEIDRKTARVKSLFKLNSYPCDHRIIVLREPHVAYFL